MIKRLIVPACAVACLLVAAPPATAAPPSSAKAFAAAALRFEQAVAAHQAEMRARYEELELERCFRAVEDAPRRAQSRVGDYLGIVLLQPLLDFYRGPTIALVLELETIPTRDPALRAGRAGWREMLGILGEAPPLDRPCEGLERWARAGYRGSVPVLSGRSLARVVERSLSASAKLERAVRRLRRLGIPARAARRFTGESGFTASRSLDMLDDAVDAALT